MNYSEIDIKNEAAKKIQTMLRRAHGKAYLAREQVGYLLAINQLNLHVAKRAISAFVMLAGMWTKS